MSQDAGRPARRYSRDVADDTRQGQRSIRSPDALSDDAAANGAFSPFRSVAPSRYGEPKPGAAPRLASPHGKRRASFRLAQELKRRIETGVYPHGEWLPIEQALLFEFPVSRTVLREAIIILECQGLIISHHGLGNRIVAAQRLEDKAVLKSIDPLALLEACMFFETEAAALAAGLSGEKSLQVPFRSFSSSPFTACHRFHVGLAEASENRVVSVSIKNLWDFALSQTALGAVLDAAFEKALKRIVDLQALVGDAVNRGDADLTRDRVRALFKVYFEAVLDLDEERRLSDAQSRSHELRLNWARRLANEKGQPRN